MASSSTTRLSLKRHATLRNSLTAGCLLAGAVSAHGQTYATTVVNPSTTQVLQYTVDTSAAGTPVFNRPGAGNPPTALSGVGTAVAYATGANTSYTPATSGTYVFGTKTVGYDPDNFEQFIYGSTTSSTPFNASSPLTNARYGQVVANTAAPGGDSYSFNLTAGTHYQFVNTGYYNASDTTPGDISVGQSATTVSLYNPGSQTNIPDASRTTAGVPGATVSQSLSVTDTSIISSFNGITIVGLQHTSLGDLTATLTHNGITVDLFDHTGATSSDVNQVGGQGSLAQFSGSNAYTFAQNGATLSLVADGAVAPPGTYKAAGNALGGFDTADAGKTLAAFAGQSVAGAWTLSFTDHQPDDIGSFLGFSFNITAAPEPSQEATFALGLLGLGGLALRARRNRTRRQAL